MKVAYRYFINIWKVQHICCYKNRRTMMMIISKSRHNLWLGDDSNQLKANKRYFTHENWWWRVLLLKAHDHTWKKKLCIHIWLHFDIWNSNFLIHRPSRGQMTIQTFNHLHFFQLLLANCIFCQNIINFKIYRFLKVSFEMKYIQQDFFAVQ